MANPSSSTESSDTTPGASSSTSTSTSSFMFTSSQDASAAHYGQYNLPYSPATTQCAPDAYISTFPLPFPYSSEAPGNAKRNRPEDPSPFVSEPPSKRQRVPDCLTATVSPASTDSALQWLAAQTLAVPSGWQPPAAGDLGCGTWGNPLSYGSSTLTGMSHWTPGTSTVPNPSHGGVSAGLSSILSPTVSTPPTLATNPYSDWSLSQGPAATEEAFSSTPSPPTITPTQTYITERQELPPASYDYGTYPGDGVQLYSGPEYGPPPPTSCMMPGVFTHSFLHLGVPPSSTIGSLSADNQWRAALPRPRAQPAAPASAAVGYISLGQALPSFPHSPPDLGSVEWLFV